jgi:hypothetical protein
VVRFFLGVFGIKLQFWGDWVLLVEFSILNLSFVEVRYC